jgi:hypothetical protein
LYYPDKFTAIISQAQEWLDMVNQSIVCSQQEGIDRDLVHFEHPRFGNIKYQIFQKDARYLATYMPKRDDTLILANIPYGLQIKGCLHNDAAWGEEELGEMVRATKFVITSPIWRIIVIHSVHQYAVVRKVLDKECNTRVNNRC